MQSCTTVDLLGEKKQKAVEMFFFVHLKIPDLVEILHFLQERYLVRREKFLI